MCTAVRAHFASVETMRTSNNVGPSGSASSSVFPLLNPHVPTPTVRKSRDNKKKGAKILHCTWFKAKKVCSGKRCKLKAAWIEYLARFLSFFCLFVLKVLKSNMSHGAALTSTTRRKKKNRRALFQPVNKRFFVHVHVCSISTGHGQVNTSNQPHSQNDRQKVQRKRIKLTSYHFRILRIPLAQCDPTQVEGRTVAVCLLPVLKCVQAAKSKQQLGSFLVSHR